MIVSLTASDAYLLVLPIVFGFSFLVVIIYGIYHCITYHRETQIYKERILAIQESLHDRLCQSAEKDYVEAQRKAMDLHLPDIPECCAASAAVARPSVRNPSRRSTQANTDSFVFQKSNRNTSSRLVKAQSGSRFVLEDVEMLDSD